MNTPELAKYRIPVAAGPRGFDYDQQQARFIGIPAAYYWRGIDQDSIGVNTDSPVVPAGRASLPGRRWRSASGCPRTSR